MGIIGAIYISGTLLFAVSTIVAGPLTDRLVRSYDSYPCMEFIRRLCYQQYRGTFPHLQVPRYLIIGGLVVGCAGAALIGPTEFIIAIPYDLSGATVINAATVHA